MTIIQESPRQTKPKKGAKRKVHEFRPFLWILVFFLGERSTIHSELWFRNVPAKSSWTAFFLVWFGGVTPDFRVLLHGISSDLFFSGWQGPSAFSAFSPYRVSSKIRPTGFIMTGLRWQALFECGRDQSSSIALFSSSGTQCTWHMNIWSNPVGQKRQIDVAGQKLPRDNFCLSLVSQLPSPRG